MKVIVNYQGVLAENTGIQTEEVSVRGSFSGLLDMLQKKHPKMKNLNYVVAVNGVITHKKKSISDGDKITLIPPAPGG